MPRPVSEGYGSGPQNHGATAWVSEHSPHTLRTLRPTARGLSALDPDAGELIVCTKPPRDRLFAVIDVETGERAVVLTTSQLFRNEKGVAPNNR